MIPRKSRNPDTVSREKKSRIPDDMLFLFGICLGVMGTACFFADLLLGYPLLLTAAIVFWPISITVIAMCLMSLLWSFSKHDSQWRLLRLIQLLMLTLIVADVLQ